MEQVVLGPVPPAAAALCGLSVLAAAALAAGDVGGGEQGDAADDGEHGDDSEELAKMESRARELLGKDGSMPVPVGEVAPSAGPRRGAMARALALMGGYKTALAAWAVGLLGVAIVSAALRPPNLFEVVGVGAGYARSPDFGLMARQKRHRGQQRFAEFGLRQEDADAAYQTLLPGDDRVLYELYGTKDVSVQSVSDLAWAVRGALAFYAAAMVLLITLCSMSARLASAFQSGGIAVGILLFLDLSVSMQTTDLRGVPVLELVPGWAPMTSYERLLFLRWFTTPIILVACLFYASHTFVDYGEHGLKYILRTMLSQEDMAKSVQLIKQSCVQRRAVMQLKTGKKMVPPEQQTGVRQRQAARAVKAQDATLDSPAALESPTARKLDFGKATTTATTKAPAAKSGNNKKKTKKNK